MAKPVRNMNFKSGAVAQLYGLLSKSGRPPNLLIPQPRVKEVDRTGEITDFSPNLSRDRFLLLNRYNLRIIMKKKITQISILLLIIALVIAGCSAGNQPQAKKTIEIVDGLGRTVSLSTVPQKIISLAPSNTEILFAIGAGKQMIGRDEFSDFPADAKGITSVGGSMGKYSLEQISALHPDLILAAEINTQEQVKSFEDLGLTVFYLSNPKDLDGLYQNIQTVGQLTGKEKESEALVASLQNRVRVVTDLQKPGTKPVKVFYEMDGSEPSKPWTAGKDSYVDVLLTLAGGMNVANDAGEGWIQYSQEALIVANPDVILLGDAAYGVTKESVTSRAGWGTLSAVMYNRIYAFDDNLVSRPGPRLVDALEQLSKLLINQ
jgi:iron complex transport system substrate-binding protein